MTGDKETAKPDDADDLVRNDSRILLDYLRDDPNRNEALKTAESPEKTLELIRKMPFEAQRLLSALIDNNITRPDQFSIDSDELRSVVEWWCSLPARPDASATLQLANVIHGIRSSVTYHPITRDLVIDLTAYKEGGDTVFHNAEKFPGTLFIANNILGHLAKILTTVAETGCRLRDDMPEETEKALGKTACQLIKICRAMKISQQKVFQQGRKLASGANGESDDQKSDKQD